MTFKHAEAVEVRLFGRSVGAVAAAPGGRLAYGFEYFPAWLRDGFSISPLHLPLERGVRYFEGLPQGTWYQLPPALADALPDRFGSKLVDAKLAELGVTVDQITSLDRLSYVADRAMGALEFKPAGSLGRQREGILDIAELIFAAREALHGNIGAAKDAKASLKQLLSVGTSAGGARAKAVINLDPETGVITSGQRPEAGKQSWLLKFDGTHQEGTLGESAQYGRIEYAYSLMAKGAGIEMPETRLLEENGRAHFMVRRFDRIDAPRSGAPQKLHMQSLCAMDCLDFNQLHTNDYASLFAVIDRLGLGASAKAQAFRRMAFNYSAMNCDDHSKNFSFLSDAAGNWRLAPAYDITFAYNSQNIWLCEHLMGVAGKFADVTQKDLLVFADRFGVEYAKTMLGEVHEALANWPDYAHRAGLSTAEAAEIMEQFSKS